MQPHELGFKGFPMEWVAIPLSIRYILIHIHTLVPFGVYGVVQSFYLQEETP